MDTVNEMQLQQQLAQAVANNHELAQALTDARMGVATLAAQLAVVQATADDLSALVNRLIAVLRIIRPMIGNGARAAFETAMAGVETPESDELRELRDLLERTEDGLYDAMANARGKQYWAEAWKGLAGQYRQLLINWPPFHSSRELAQLRRSLLGGDDGQ